MKKRTIKKAIMYATIGFKGSVLEKFRAVKAAGFEGVEPMSHMNQDEVVKALRGNRPEGGQRLLQHPLGQAALAPRREACARRAARACCSALQDAKRYGATSVLLVPGVVNKDVTYDDCFKRSVAEIRKAVPVAKELGVKIAIENVWNNFITKPEQAKAFLDEIDSPHVGWHFDIGNVIRYGPPEDWIPVLGKRILKLHIKEYSKVEGFQRALLRRRQQLAGHHEGAGRRRLPGLGNLRAARRAVQGRRRVQRPGRTDGPDFRQLMERE